MNRGLPLRSGAALCGAALALVSCCVGVAAARAPWGWRLVIAATVVALAVALTWWLAGRALAPLEHVARLVRQILDGDLGWRLEPADDEEVGPLVDGLNALLARLEDASEGMKRFTADATRELRGPTAALAQAIETASASTERPDELRTALRRARESVDALRDIVENLVVLARADAGGAVVVRRPLRLDELVVQAAESLRPLAHHRGLALAVDVEPVEAAGDDGALLHLLTNVVSRAIRVTAAPGATSRGVEVWVRVDAGDAVIRVADGGPSVKDADLARFFERFHRGEGARARVGGGGLELAVARCVTLSHGGSIAAARCDGGGALVTIRLPRGAK